MSDNITNDKFADQDVPPIAVRVASRSRSVSERREGRPKVNDPADLDVLNELIKREPIFHRPEFGTTRQDFENMTVETFWEVGASGRRYNRKYVMDTLEQRHAEPHEDIWETRDFHCLEIAPDNYLLTYTLIQGERVTRRSTIWRRCDPDWKIVYHQGTLVLN
jgi:hypothetical protein